ncbi:putative metal-dependent HD superfamily phosphohydrolase [Dysgonomonas alginatilytica]|uniref:Putative metal-dependent HD superfamily phosphohydrolase n=1 Tax=Dysgonomonas alginatilytica TaxID=1605892 RepID=A0A2V3PTW6_9BACT|nr:hypothetical protein [Dysgonomonas alginatilytica]PXV69147.1 putative metal-dependent HD superfamily phosphohydrolase [Dysgonomonas alginatilytica]
MLKTIFTELVKKYTADTLLSKNLWNEIVINYCDAGRYYHNLNHLEAIISELSDVKDSIPCWDTAMFSVFYHDIVYNALRSDNEAQSADKAQLRLQEIGFPKDQTTQCILQILATKGHNPGDDITTQLFIDADLAILGKSTQAYTEYSENLRKEFFIYTDKEYKAGRKKILKHFLAMDRIFKTEHLYNKYEKQARKNIESELSLL